MEMLLERRYRLTLFLLVAHVGALVFGLIGLLYVIPNLADFASNPQAMRVYNWSIENAGATHIIFGALAMFAFGWVAIGFRRTAIFFGVTYTLSLYSELIGTSYGWPFGNYEYTSYLGLKVLDRVPYTIPLSWFYIGFSVYLLGIVIVQKLNWRYQTAWALALGAWFLTVWDLVLDPAMAHDSLPVKFWIWSETGAYFGMPIKNFIGWTATGLIFMGISRWLWQEEPDTTTRRFPVVVPFAVFAVNTVWASVISASVHLYIPIVLAFALGVIPAGVALFVGRNATASPSSVPELQHRPIPGQ